MYNQLVYCITPEDNKYVSNQICWLLFVNGSLIKLLNLVYKHTYLTVSSLSSLCYSKCIHTHGDHSIFSCMEHVSSALVPFYSRNVLPPITMLDPWIHLILSCTHRGEGAFSHCVCYTIQHSVHRFLFLQKTLLKAITCWLNIYSHLQFVPMD